MTIYDTKPALGAKGPAVIVTVWVMGFFAIVAVGLRAVYARKINGRWRWDFIWAVLALITGVIAASILTVAACVGLGNHVLFLESYDLNDIWATVYWLYMSIYVGLAATTFAKFSVASLIMQILGPNSKFRKWILYGVCVLVTVVNTLQIIFSYTQCSPRNKTWYRLEPGVCNGNQLAIDWNYVQGATGAFADLILALLPVTLAWGLKTTRRVKIMFCLLMAVCTLPAIVTVFRVTHIPNAITTKDITESFGVFMILCAVEFWFIIIFSSIPVLRPLFLRVFYGVKSMTGSRTGTGGASRRTANTQQMASKNNTTVKSRILDDDAELGKDLGMGIVVTKAYAVGPEIEEKTEE